MKAQEGFVDMTEPTHLPLLERQGDKNLPWAQPLFGLG